MRMNKGRSLRVSWPWLAGLAAAAVAGLAMLTFAGAAAAGTTTLYDQTDSGGYDGYVSSLVPADAQVADDFVVPATVNWNLTSITADGVDYGDLNSVTVTIYSDASGAPGAQVYTTTTSSFTDTPNAIFSTYPYGYPGGDLTIPISVKLSPGHYWISVQGGNDYWYAQIRDAVSNDPAMWQNPDGFYDNGCQTWTDMATCFSFTGDGAPGTLDTLFSLSGTSTPVYAGTPGQPNCVGKTISALSNQYNGLGAAATALGFASVKALQLDVKSYCRS